jgi:hypothetical protein
MMSLSFTTTATVRPELLEQTYHSFCSNLTGVNFKELQLFINVDPVPTSSEADRLKVVAVAQKYFGKVVHNLPQSGNFPMAVRWAWMSTNTKYVFNLEDDWLLTERVDVPSLISYLESFPNAVGVSLNAYVFKSDLNRIRLSPGLLRGAWAREAASNLRAVRCPERQLRSSIPKHLIRPMLNYPDYSTKTRGRIIVRDTGRLWREKKRLVKDNGKSTGFVTWKRKG